jgi:hypothetical protein
MVFKRQNNQQAISKGLPQRDEEHKVLFTALIFLCDLCVFVGNTKNHF